MKKLLLILGILLSLAFYPQAAAAKYNIDWVHLPDTVVREFSGHELGSASPVQLNRNEYISLDVNVAPGNYWIAISYKVLTPVINQTTILVTVDNNYWQIPVTSIWADATKEYTLDRFGNEILPEQIALDSFHIDYFTDAVGLSRLPIVFDLLETSQLTIQNLSGGILIESVFIMEVPTIPSFTETAGANAPMGSDVIIIEGQEHLIKSHSFIGSANVQDPMIHPYELGRRLLNTAFSYQLGDKIVWQFYVETAGRYQLSFRYSQSERTEMEVYRNIFINGKIPSAEFINVPFTFTSVLGAFDNMTLDTEVFLEAGWNTIALQSDATILQPYYDRVRDILSSLNYISTELRRITGVAATAHRNRVWAMEQYMPGITQQLTDYSAELLDIFENFPRLSDRNPPPLSALRVASGDFERIVHRIDRLPANMNWINDISLILADLINVFHLQPLSIDRIYIHHDNFELAPARMGFFRGVWQVVREFFHALFNANEEFAVSRSDDPDELVVWVARSIQFVEVMQRLIDTRYTPETGQRVRLSIMPSEQRLILSNASGTNPDAAVGIMTHFPFEFALRGAVADFTQFDDFIPFVEDNFEPATFQAYIFRDGIYGLTETKTFRILFYREDILNHLGLPVPDTWEDVQRMMPILRRNAMNLFIPLSAGVGFKPFFGTAPFMFQMGAEIYTEDGMATALHTPRSLEAFELMTDLYRIYALQDNIPSFYQSFRLGTVPIGVADMNQLIQFRTAAPEISGLWNIAPSPGIMDDNGVVRRYQLAATSACIIMESSDRQQEAWEFLRWWMSSDIQIEFAHNLVLQFGPAFVWGSANLNAFESLPFSEHEREVILEQWRWAREVPRHPASYIVEREISNAWFATVGDGISSRIALDRSMTIANREMTRRLEEFGYVENGIPVRDFIIRPIESFLSNNYIGR